MGSILSFVRRRNQDTQEDVGSEDGPVKEPDSTSLDVAKNQDHADQNEANQEDVLAPVQNGHEKDSIPLVIDHEQDKSPSFLTEDAEEEISNESPSDLAADDRSNGSKIDISENGEDNEMDDTEDGSTMSTVSEESVDMPQITLRGGLKQYPCDYPGCDWSFTRSSQVLRHKSRVHKITHVKTPPKKEPFICSWPECNKILSTKYRLNQHEDSHKRKQANYNKKKELLKKNDELERRVPVDFNYSEEAFDGSFSEIINTGYLCENGFCNNGNETPNLVESHISNSKNESFILQNPEIQSQKA